MSARPVARLLAAAFLACALPASAGTGGTRGGDGLEDWVRDLDRAREPAWSAAFERLVELGPPAAARVLSDFEGADFAARRGRAKLVRELVDPAQCARLLELVDDPDPQVRRLLSASLGNLALAEERAAERVAALERLARDDANDWVRGEARSALGECALAEAVPALDRLLFALPADEAEKAAQTLALVPGARERLIARVQAAFDGGSGAPAALPDGVLAALLRGYGRALAEVPLGGREVRERLPLLRARTHPAPAVRAAALLAWSTFVARTVELAEPERADFVLERLGAEGWPEEQCLRRRIDVAWLERGDPDAALALAQALETRARALPRAEADFWEGQALLLQGAARLVRRELEPARALFGVLIGRLEAARTQRADLFPSPRAREGREGYRESAGGAWYAEGLLQLALAHEWNALSFLVADPDDARCLEDLRGAHQLFLEARAVLVRTGNPDPANLDVLFERDLSPQMLVLLNEDLRGERRSEALDWALALARAWASVAGDEMLGFEPRPGLERRLSEPLFDDRRRAALLALRQAEGEDFDRQRSELASRPVDPDQAQFLRRLLSFQLQELRNAGERELQALRGREPRTLDASELRTVFVQPLSYLTYSQHALALGDELRGEGRAAEARALAERALATLRGGAASPVLVEWDSARFELLRGSTFTDEGKPEEAERAYLEGVRRLEAMESHFEDLKKSAEDGGESRTRDGQLRLIRERRADALLSLAVNANVRMGNPARALEYFERAYELNQSPFMRVLRACYRARSGKADEARSVLRGVTPTPSSYYNLACTHALLGDKDLALDFLERDFAANYPTTGARARQREWARKDPDLSSLRGEPRFTRLLENDPR